MKNSECITHEDEHFKMCLTKLDFCIRNLLTVFIINQWVGKKEIRVSNKGNHFPLD